MTQPIFMQSFFMQALALLTAAALTLCAGRARAADFIITDCSDALPPQPGSLRHAVDLTNAGTGADRILVPQGTSCTVKPVAPFDLKGPVELLAGDDRDMRLRVVTDAQLDGATVFRVAAANTVFEGVELVGKSSQRAIYVQDSAQLEFAGGRIAGFQHPTGQADPAYITPGQGGAMLVHGSATVQRSFIEDCAATWGGAIAHLPTGLSQLIMKGNLIYNNSASAQAGAILMGAPFYGGHYSTFWHNHFYQNDAVGDGGVLYAVNLYVDLKHNAFMENESQGRGGALFVNGGRVDAHLNTFIDDVSMLGVAHEIRAEGGQLELNSNIIGQSGTYTSGGGSTCELVGVMSSATHNVVQETSCTGWTGNTFAADMGLTGPAWYAPSAQAPVPATAQLWLFGLAWNSPAIKAADPNVCTITAGLTDLRGEPRPALCDAGAFEAQ